MRDPLCCLSYWFPVLESSGIPVPRTRIIQAECELAYLLDNEIPDGFSEFTTRIKDAIAQIGSTPCFLRTDLTSGKHGWKETCFVDDIENLAMNVQEIVEYSALVDFFGLPTDVWAVRELLSTEPAFTAFNGLPITKERRYFVRDGKVEHHQPYWIPGSIEGRTVSESDWRDKLDRLNHESSDEIERLTCMSEEVGKLFEGYWSVDWLWTTDRGWVCIDMAEGDKSFRWSPVDEASPKPRPPS